MSTPAATQINEDVRKKVQDALAANPRAMTSMLAAQLQIPECEVVRCLPNGNSKELDATRCEELIRSFESLGAVHVIVNSGTVVLEAQGEFGGFSTAGPFLNVQTKTLDMHIKVKDIATIFAVEKPSHMDGSKTLSVQFYSKTGTAAFKMFLNFSGVPTPERQAYYDSVRAKYGIAS